MRRRSANIWRHCAGAALVEAGFAFPVLIALGLGGFDISNYVYQHQAVAVGVRDAARFLARNGCATANPGANPALACSAQIANAGQIAVYGDIGGATPRVANWTTANISVAFTATANPINAATGDPTYRGGNPIYTVTVSTSFSYAQFGYLSILGNRAPKIAVAHTERVVGG